MSHKNIHVAYDSARYGTFPPLSELRTLDPSAVVRDAHAERALEATPDECVLAVAPESTATAYRLASEPLTALRLDDLPASAREELDDGPSVDLAAYDVLAWGSAPEREDHALTEYA